MLRKMGLFSSFAFCNASGPQGYQFTGLWACCSKYGLMVSINRLVCFVAVSCMLVFSSSVWAVLAQTKSIMPAIAVIVFMFHLWGQVASFVGLSVAENYSSERAREAKNRRYVLAEASSS